MNAERGQHNKTLTDAQYAAIIDTAPVDYLALQGQPHYGLKDEVAAMMEAIKQSPPTVTGATFNPATAQVNTARQSLIASCKANGTEAFVMAGSGA